MNAFFAAHDQFYRTVGRLSSTVSTHQNFAPISLGQPQIASSIRPDVSDDEEESTPVAEGEPAAQDAEVDGKDEDDGDGEMLVLEDCMIVLSPHRVCEFVLQRELDDVSTGPGPRSAHT